MKFLLIVILMFSLCFNVEAQRIQRHENGKYGLAVKKNNGGLKWLASPQYIVIEPYTRSAQSYIVCNEYGKWGVITSAGKPIIECVYPTKETAIEEYEITLYPSLKNYASNRLGYGSKSQYEDFTLSRDYSTYIKEYVEQKINAWQKKGEFEKTVDYQNRVTEVTRKAMVMQLTKEVCDECLKKATDKELRLTLGEYDADNETFLVESEIGKIVLPVPIDKAPSFKLNWNKITSTNTYDIVNGKIILRSATFMLNNKIEATYSDKHHALYAQANIQYNFDPIEIPHQDDASYNQPIVSQKNIQIGKADVDINIPISKDNNDKTFALIFANETYRNESAVRFAYNDGEAVNQYFTKALGIPQSNVHFITDATKNDMIREFDWLKNVGNAFNDDISIMVYYAGHGVPSEADGSTYLIPVDGIGTNTKTLYPLSDFYEELSSIKSNSSIVFLDACFSGSLRGNGMLASSRGIALKAKPETPKSNMVVFCAASGDETAWPYEEKNHGLFTYFILKKLQDTKGNVSLGALADYVIDQVGKYSIVSNSKKQTPNIILSTNMAFDWGDLKLKK